MSLVIATRDRPEDLGRSLPSVIANLRNLAELIIIDQSIDRRTERVIRPYLREPRVRYLRSETRGLSAARNFGLLAVKTPLIGFTDDDCLLPTDWAVSVCRHLEEPDTAAFFGAVVAEPFDWRTGHTPSVPYPPNRTLDSADPSSIPGIMGANMAVRREALFRIGGFDPYLGAGARFKSAEDVDVAYRFLLAGYRVAVRPEPAVMHFGFRTYASGASRTLVRATSFGMGAYLAKHARMGDVKALQTFADYFANTSRGALRNVRRGVRPFGLGRIAWTLSGFVDSYHCRINRDGRVFVGRGARRRNPAAEDAPNLAPNGIEGQ